jgi:radical SAM protein with 4Fe4S-binding SPASM domain
MERKYFPRTVVWEITFACNMKCIHCGTSAGKARHDELSTGEALILIDELAGLGTEEITLSGGEPLLRKDWRLLAEHSKNSGIKTYLVTNGYAVNEKVVEDFDKIQFNNIAVSLDGTEKTHNYIRQRDDAFDKAVSAMQLMNGNDNIRFCSISQVSGINLDELDDIKKILLDNGCRQWRIQMTTATGRMREHDNLVMSVEDFPRFIDKLLEIKDEGDIILDVGENIGFYGCKGTKLRDGKPYFGCYAGMFGLGIESNGNIKGCLSMPEYLFEGNIRDSSLTQIWDNPDSFAYNRKFTNMTAEGFCRECKYVPMCRGGCATTSFAKSGSRADNPYCIYQFECKQGVVYEDNDMIASLLDHVNKKLSRKTESVDL